MAESNVIGEIDLVSVGEVTDLGSTDGPCVSLFMPTHRFGPETLEDPVRLRHLIDTAALELRDNAVSEAVIDDVSAPLRALVDDAAFWQHQADGLAAYSAPGRFGRFRVPLPLAEQVTVAASFRVRPLLPLLSDDEAFFVLAVSQNSVRLLEATRFTIRAVEPGLTVGSMAEALADEDPERQLQYRSAGGEAQFHGHGAGAELDKAAVERFLRAVDRAVAERLGDSHRPLVLACVGYYLPIYESVTRYPNLMDTVVEGNPEHRSPAELHAAAWPVIEPLLARRLDAELDRFHDAVGTGNAITVIEEIVARAGEGRVDTLFVAEGPALWGRVDPDDDTVTIATQPSIACEDLVDRAVLDTLNRGGTIRAADAAMIGTDTVAAALLRY